MGTTMVVGRPALVLLLLSLLVGCQWLDTSRGRADDIANAVVLAPRAFGELHDDTTLPANHVRRIEFRVSSRQAKPTE